MIATILIVTYIVGCIIAWPIITRKWAEDMGCYDTTDYMMSLLLGLCMAFFWPALALIPLAFGLKWAFFPDTFKEDKVKERVNSFIKRS